MTIERTPRVSVVIPCYRNAQFLAEAIESVLAQTYSPVEIIVIDDGSPDDTPAVAARFAGRIEYVRQVNAGVSAARNHGAKHARGEALLFLDADDRIDPDHVANLAGALAEHPTADIACSGWRDVSPEGVELATQPPPDLTPDAFHALIRSSVAALHAYLIRRAVFINSGGFNTELRANEDWDLWLRLAGAGVEFVRAAGHGAVYRRLPATRSGNSFRVLESGLQLLSCARRVHCDCRLCDEAFERAYDFVVQQWLTANVLRELSFEQNVLLHDMMSALDRRVDGRLVRSIGRLGFGVARRGRLKSWAQRFARRGK